MTYKGKRGKGTMREENNRKKIELITVMSDVNGHELLTLLPHTEGRSSGLLANKLQRYLGRARSNDPLVIDEETFV
ncbi:MAG: hypothetical protein Q8P11_02455, partial [bacterium]|nr:hypothetical protein [bacterium]